MLPLSKRFALLLALALPITLYASDYTYQETTQLTGGSLLHMMKSVGMYSVPRRANAATPSSPPSTSKTTAWPTSSPDSIEIIDLDKETITNIDVQKKTYTVMTFEQMKQAMANARAADGEAAAPSSRHSSPQQIQTRRMSR